MYKIFWDRNLKRSSSVTEKKRIANIVLDQHKLAINEDPQSIFFTFDEMAPRSRKDLFEIAGVSPRMIWMEHEFLYNKIVETRPDELFHPIHRYGLRWFPPGSKFLALIPLTDRQLQENMVVQLQRMKPTQKKTVVFHFCCLLPSLPMFREKVHPASLWSFRTREEVLDKICNEFLEGKVGMEDFNLTLASRTDAWRKMVYNLLKPDERVYHEYLNQEEESVEFVKEISKQYMDGEIDIDDFADFKFPERKEKRRIESLVYPLPVKHSTPCIVCSVSDAGVDMVKCLSCHNVICTICIRTVFLDSHTSVGSFLLLHRKYCLRTGVPSPITPNVAAVPAFLRELVETSKSSAIAAAIKLYDKKKAEDVVYYVAPLRVVEGPDNVTVDANENITQQASNIHKRDEEIIAAWIGDVNTLKNVVVTLRRQFGKVERDFMKYQVVLDNPSKHNEKFVARAYRLQSEVFANSKAIANKLDALMLNNHELVKRRPFGVEEEIENSSLDEVDLLLADLCRRQDVIVALMHSPLSAAR